MSNGDKLKQTREELGLSQRKVAAIIRSSQSTVWRWESNRAPMSAVQFAGVIALITQYKKEEQRDDVN